MPGTSVAEEVAREFCQLLESQSGRRRWNGCKRRRSRGCPGHNCAGAGRKVAEGCSEGVGNTGMVGVNVRIATDVDIGVGNCKNVALNDLTSNIDAGTNIKSRMKMSTKAQRIPLLI